MVNSLAIDMNLCDDWIPYKKEKCFKVIENRANNTVAQSKCAQLYPNASLITIGSADEQAFVTKFLSYYITVADRVWTGMANTKGSGYSNWVDDFPNKRSVLYEYCVQMSIIGNFAGKWYSEMCAQRALVELLMIKD
ncbi:unnamed protein product [Medioppia subpectinata]|uniref:C-type lectin domain-containing protein n=1 Tax=Medioppia subpectinata TaxID=1979941 RepID=A0A7R9KT11_9ACAR|nr:unnamed protein product [Medioppia subpectinata]CAG2108108.1 unnamed protein product [Medioppia subpectinata]